MTIGRRLSLTAAVAVAVAVALASVASYVAVRSKLRSEIDDSLRERAFAVRPFGPPLIGPDGRRDRITLDPHWKPPTAGRRRPARPAGLRRLRAGRFPRGQAAASVGPRATCSS